MDGVSLAVEEAEIFGVLGPNGAGKTTTVESVLGLRVPDGGTIRVCGLDPVADRTRTTLIVGAQLQASELPGKLTVAEALQPYADCYPSPADWRTLAARLGLAEKFDTRVAQLSGGQKPIAGRGRHGRGRRRRRGPRPGPVDRPGHHAGPRRQRGRHREPRRRDHRTGRTPGPGCGLTVDASYASHPVDARTPVSCRIPVR